MQAGEGEDRGRPVRYASRERPFLSWEHALAVSLDQTRPHPPSCGFPRRGLFGTLSQQLQCGIFGRTALVLVILTSRAL